MTRKLLVLALLAITCLSVSAQSFGLIRIAVAPLREEPSHAAEMGSQLVLGTPVKLAGIAGGEFWEVTAPDGYHGYIHQSSIEPLTDEAATRWKSADRVIVTADIAWLKNMDGTPAGYAPFGSVLTPADWNKLNIEPEGAKAGYVLLELPDGKLAEGNVYDFAIFSDFCRQDINSQTIEGVCNEGLSMLGSPYLWGGTTPLAPDCSGLTQLSWLTAGILLPRNASQQALVGEEVPSLAQAQKGDLLFFANENGRIVHVGLYLGDNQLVHSSAWVWRGTFNKADATAGLRYYRRTPDKIRRITKESAKNLYLRSNSLYFND